MNMIKRLCIIVSCIMILLYMVIGAFGTFELASGACSGGYVTELYNCQENAIKNIIQEELDYNELGQIHYNLTYEGRSLATEFVNEQGKTVKLYGKLIWYWNDSVSWIVG